MKKTNVFTIIGIVVAVVLALAGAAYAIYRFVYKKRLATAGESFEFGCEDCKQENCDECPLEKTGEEPAEETEE